VLKDCVPGLASSRCLPVESGQRFKSRLPGGIDHRCSGTGPAIDFRSNADERSARTRICSNDAEKTERVCHDERSSDPATHRREIGFMEKHRGAEIFLMALGGRAMIDWKKIRKRAIGKNDYQPSGPGTITRITAHQVEVLWEDETARRYRRAQLHNLRHWKLLCEHKAPIPPLEPDHLPCATTTG